MWSNFNGYITYRGSASDLENECAQIRLYNTTGIFRSLMSEKIVTLKGLLEAERIKTDMTLLDPEKNKYYVPIEGFVNIPNRPKYRQ